LGDKKSQVFLAKRPKLETVKDNKERTQEKGAKG